MSYRTTISAEPVGTGLSRLLICLAGAGGSPLMAAKQLGDDPHLAVFFHTQPHAREALDVLAKSAVPAGQLGNAGWAGALASTGLDSEIDQLFVSVGQSVLAQLADRARRAPFRAQVPRLTAAGDTGWVAEGYALPAAADTLDQLDALAPVKRGALKIFSKELQRLGDPQAERSLREGSIRACANALDVALLDPASGAGTGPGSITNNAQAISLGSPSTVTTADIDACLREITTSGAGLVWIASPQTLGRALVMTGRVENPGRFCGLPAIASGNVPAGLLVLLDAAELVLALGGYELEIATEATVEMDTAPSQDGVTPTAAAMVSLWQSGLFGVRLSRYVNWQLARTGAVVYTQLATA